MTVSPVVTPEKPVNEAVLNEQQVAKFDEKIKFHTARALAAHDFTVFIAEMDEVYAAEAAKARFIKWIAKQPRGEKKANPDKGFYIFAGIVATAQVFYGGYLTALIVSM